MTGEKTERATMSEAQLEQHLASFIHQHNVCTLATCKDNVPRATALEYEADGATLYATLGPGRKLENLRANPIISASIHDPLKGWSTVKGIQITATARLITNDHPDYQAAWRIFNRANTGKEGWDTPPAKATLLKIVPQKIELLETALKEKGYKTRQVWEASKQ